jgi:hypothetical protein
MQLKFRVNYINLIIRFLKKKNDKNLVIKKTKEVQFL